MIRSERKVGDEPAGVTTRYYISSLTGDAQRVLAAVPSHWGIENELHRLRPLGVGRWMSPFMKT
jgi:predicted transposase YbfD/YdcC